MALEPPVLPRRRRRRLVARGRVEAVRVDVALLRRRRVVRGVAWRGHVLDAAVHAGNLQLPVRGVGDKPVVPPRLECAHLVVVVVRHRVPDLMEWGCGFWSLR